jgi:uncharacterized protein (TIRG00374 family)
MEIRLHYIVKIAISFGLLFYVFKQIEFSNLMSLFSGVSLFVVIFALCIIFLQINLKAIKWKVIIASEDINIPYLCLLESYLIGNFFSLFLPSSFGGDIYRIVSLKKYNLNFFQNTSSVLFERMTGLFALASIALISISFFYKNQVHYDLLIIYFFSLFLFWVLTSNRIVAFLSEIRQKIVHYLFQIIKSFHTYRSNKKVFFISLGISLIVQINIVLLNKLFCYALHIDIHLSNLFMIIPLIYLMEMIPTSINGFGVREGAFVFFFTQLGFKKEEALAVALFLITLRYIFSLTIGGSILLKRFLISDNKKIYR